nr:hypothetical protein [Candidatus Sigynarchaeota archaeon]
ITCTPIEGHVIAENNIFTMAGEVYTENGTLHVQDSTVSASVTIGGTDYPYNKTGGGNTIPVVNGTFKATFTIPIVDAEQMNVTITWGGAPGLIIGCTNVYTLNLTEYISALSISIVGNPDIVLVGDVKNYYTFFISNTGNSTLVFNATPVFQGVNARLATWTYSGLWEVGPGESFSFGVVLLVTEPGFGKTLPLNFSITISVYSLETRNYKSIAQNFTGEIRSADIFTRLSKIWYLGFFGLVGLLAVVAIMIWRNAVREAKKPSAAGELARSKATRAGKEKEYIVKKPGEVAGDEKPDNKKYRSIDDVIKEVKGDATDAEEKSEEKKTSANE